MIPAPDSALETHEIEAFCHARRPIYVGGVQNWDHQKGCEAEGSSGSQHLAVPCGQVGSL